MWSMHNKQQNQETLEALYYYYYQTLEHKLFISDHEKLGLAPSEHPDAEQEGDSSSNM